MSEKTASIRLLRVALAEIKPHPRNPRRHPDPGSRQWEILSASLGHDYFDPLVLNERNGMLVSGHFRCKVLAHLGFTHADVSVVDYDEATHLARMIAANELLGSWETDMLEYQWQHEPILYGWKPGAGHYWQGGYAQSTVIDDEEKNLSQLAKPELVEIIQRLRNERNTTIVREPRNQSNKLHPTVKPLGLVARQVWNSSKQGDTVLELFGGSGTTLLAAHQTGRKCVATELEPKFCAVILQRAKEHGLAIEKIGDASAA